MRFGTAATTPLALVALAVTVPLAPVARAGATCPATTLTCGSDVRSEETTSGSWTCGSGTTRARYDLAVPKLDALNLQFGYARVATADDYVILGPPDGSSLPVVLRVTARVTSGYGYGFGFGSGEVRVSEPSAGEAILFENNAGSQSAVLELTIPATVGQSFRVSYSGTAQGGTGSAFAEISAIEFAGLPPGSRIESCRGFLVDVPVPAVPASWGAIKSRYR